MFRVKKGLFEEAAEQIEIGSSYSCNALGIACNKHYRNVERIHQIIDSYAEIISPVESRAVKIADFEYGKTGVILSPGMAKDHRVIALLMVGQAWKDL